MAKKQQTRLALFVGDKGGVGKSFVASLYVDRLLADSRDVVIVDTDQRNPDVSRRFSEVPGVSIERVPLAEKGGVMDLLTIVSQATPGSTIVVSTPAGICASLVHEHDAIVEGLRELKVPLHVVWPIDRLADSINLLRIFLESFHADLERLLVVRNGFFGATEAFARWSQSETRRRVLGQTGAVETYLPELHSRIVDAVADVPFSRGEELLKFGERMEMRRWLREAHSVFNALEVG